MHRTPSINSKYGTVSNSIRATLETTGTDTVELGSALEPQKQSLGKIKNYTGLIFVKNGLKTVKNGLKTCLDQF